MQIKDCVILMGGMGTRCYPFSYVLPKCMIPILNKPIIEYIVEDVVKADFENIYLVLPKFIKSKVCVDYFKENKKVLKYLKEKNSPYYETMKNRKFPKIIPVYCKTPNGAGGAVLACEKYLKNKHFAVINGDDVFIGNPSSLCELKNYAQDQNCCVMACMQVSIQESQNYGMIEFVEMQGHKQVTKIFEKPKNNTILTYANVGRYILNSDIFSYIKSFPKINGEFLFTEAISDFAQNNKLLCMTLKSKRYDCGNIDGIIKANIDLYN